MFSWAKYGALAGGLALIVAPLWSCQAANSDASQSASVPQYGYGTTPTAKQIKGWDIDVLPDGTGLPPGTGTVTEGEQLFGARCAACHGFFGKGVANYPSLNNSSLADLKSSRPDKTIGNFWPYAPKIFSYIHKAMPFPLPGSLSNDQSYALTAFLLNLNNIVPSNFVANAQTLAKVKMPNRDGFIVNDLKPDTHATECMKNCATSTELKITSNAKSLKGLTPPTTGALAIGQNASGGWKRQESQ